MLNPKQLWQVCRFEVLRRLRSPSGIVALLVLVIASGVVGRQLAGAAKLLNQASSGQDAAAFEMVGDLVAGLTGFPIDTVRATLDAHSPPLVGAFAFLMFVMPLLTLTLGYDQCASDIETRHARFLAFRIDRITLYVGKLLGAWVMLSMIFAVAGVSMAGYIWVAGGAMPTFADFVYLGRLVLTVSITALPLLTLLGLLGSLRGRARRVVLLAVLLWIGVSIVAGVLRHALELEMLASGVDLLWPTTGRWSLLLDEGGPWLLAAVRVSVYSLVVGALGLLHFRKRDL